MGLTLMAPSIGAMVLDTAALCPKCAIVHRECEEFFLIFLKMIYLKENTGNFGHYQDKIRLSRREGEPTADNDRPRLAR